LNNLPFAKMQLFFEMARRGCFYAFLLFEKSSERFVHYCWHKAQCELGRGEIVAVAGTGCHGPDTPASETV